MAEIKYLIQKIKKQIRKPPSHLPLLSPDPHPLLFHACARRACAEAHRDEESGEPRARHFRAAHLHFEALRADRLATERFHERRASPHRH